MHATSGIKTDSDVKESGKPRLRIRNCSLLDPEVPQRIRRNVDILIVGPSIRGIVPTGTIPETENEQSVDGTHRLAVPGLVNAHTHSPENLLRGVTAGKYLESWLYEVFAYRRDFSPREIYLCALLGATEMLTGGTTTALDHFGIGSNASADILHAAAEAYRDIGMRAAIAPLLEDEAPPEQTALPLVFKQLLPHPTSRPYADALANILEGFFERWHGTEGDRIHCLAGPSNLMWASDGLLEKCADVAQRWSSGLHLHVAETQFQQWWIKEHFGESAIRALKRRDVLNSRTSMAHCIWIDEEDMRLLEEQRVTVIHNPVSNLRLGSGIAPVKELLANNVSIALGTDGAASNDSQNLVEVMKLAALLPNREGFNADEGLGEVTLLQMGTVNGARAAGWNERVGTIAPGWIADVVLLDFNWPSFVPLNDALRQWIYAGGDRAVQTVIVNGEIVLDNGMPTQVDAMEAASELKERLERNPSGSKEGGELRRQLVEQVERFFENSLDDWGQRLQR